MRKTRIYFVIWKAKSLHSTRPNRPRDHLWGWRRGCPKACLGFPAISLCNSFCSKASNVCNSFFSSWLFLSIEWWSRAECKIFFYNFGNTIHYNLKDFQTKAWQWIKLAQQHAVISTIFQMKFLPSSPSSSISIMLFVSLRFFYEINDSLVNLFLNN